MHQAFFFPSAGGEKDEDKKVKKTKAKTKKTKKAKEKKKKREKQKESKLLDKILGRTDERKPSSEDSDSDTGGHDDSSDMFVHSNSTRNDKALMPSIHIISCGFCLHRLCALFSLSIYIYIIALLQLSMEDSWPKHSKRYIGHLLSINVDDLSRCGCLRNGHCAMQVECRSSD